MELVIITGMSGAGKSNAMNAMEDLGFYCVDNLPPRLLGKFLELCAASPNEMGRVAIAIDVCHATGAGASPARSMPITKVGLTTGPVIHPALLKVAMEVAEANGIDVQVQASGRGTSTDADAIQIVRAGIPCLLISIPLRYMHTTVEVISEEAVRQAGKLMAMFIAQLARRWEEIQWY